MQSDLPSSHLSYFPEFFTLQVKPFVNSFQSYFFCCKCWLSYLWQFLAVWISICSAEYVQKYFEVVFFSYSLIVAIVCIARWEGWWEGLMRRNGNAQKFCVSHSSGRTDQNWLPKTVYCIRCAMVCEIGSSNWNAKTAFWRASMVGTYYTRLFWTGQTDTLTVF